MLGRLLGGRYKVIKVLGSGGFGHTYIAEDTQRPGNPWCVLKHLSFSSDNPVMLQQVRRLFQAEAETLERLGRHDQIPQLLAYFEQDQEFYLVQEFIEGHPLSDELNRGKRFSEAQTIKLLEDVLGVLQYVHNEQVIHRDIKPDNLIRRYRDGKLVLIDFGAVKTIGTAVTEAQQTTTASIPIYTSGYGASEQCLGKPRFSSDIYALGIIGIQALTGLRPFQLPQDSDTMEIIWHDQAEVRQELAAILDKMVQYHFSHRYQTVSEVLQALHLLTQDDVMLLTQAPVSLPSTLSDSPPRSSSPQTLLPSQPLTTTEPASARRGWQAKSWMIGVGAAAIAAIVGVVVVRQFLPTPVSPSVSQAQSSQADRISLGEEILTPGLPDPAKQQGIEYLAQGKYDPAIAALEIARRKDPRDPETLIYLNNARIRDRKAYTIAVVVQLGVTTDTSQEVLRGVAQAQNTLNQAGGIQGIPLKVAIASDDNQPAIAQQIAKTLVERPDVLGVIGHGTSDTTLAAGEVYEAGQLVMIAPVSSAVQLSGLGDYIFRTVPSDRFTARALCDYMLKTLQARKVAIFYNSASRYSQSLSEEFKNALFYSQGEKPVAEYDLSNPTFNAFESMEQSRRYGAQVLMLAPDNTVANQAMQVVLVNRKRLNVLAGDSIYSTRLLQVWGDAATGMILAVPAGAIEQVQSPFQQRAVQLWQQSVSWRGSMAYDAAQALITALQRDSTRQGVQRSLSSSAFSATGATGAVRFQRSGDREAALQLVTVSPIRKGKSLTGFEFKPVIQKNTARRK